MAEHNENTVAPEEVVSVNFIEAEINKDNEKGVYGGRVHTRFPPEPNGYLHIGHAKSICLNFNLGKEYNGLTNLRFDDTNPEKEDVEYVNSIMEDVKWLGFDWDGEARYASDYFGQMYEYAKKLISLGKAYVDDQTAEEIRQTRGDFNTPGTNSPYRNRSVEENLALFEDMKNGKFKDGEKVLRAKIDMADPNIVMRDPVLYRIVNAPHHRTGTEWNIYPMYDFAHPIEDAIERITHSVCTLEFEVHRPLYDWVLADWEDTEIPRQIEFARLNVSKMVMSKRKLRALVEAGLVSGWDDPRMPTISGLRRRGYTPESIREFCERIGVAKADSVVDIALLEFCIREDLKLKVTRPMVVLDPVKVIIDNYPEGQTELVTVENNPENEELGSREVTFGREIYIERADFMEEPVKKFFRLAPGKEVRLKGAYFITCTSFEKDADGNITEIHCTYDPETKSGSGNTRKVKGTLHWVEASTSVDMEVRLYDYLLRDDADDKDFMAAFNTDSLQVLQSKGEASLATTVPGDRFQFLRQGYFVTDIDSTPEHIVMNRIVGLRDSWAKQQNKG
ncbi:glutamine--tRNA ligase/YqeY domain fusion protein [Veillonella agrestimuris]|uniref:glutamine--tRNA ligase/YqeY domain fusion protein n=1 Tax=Veillonella agrestimuris TaxID=2941340 RepID=UPI00203BDC9C|nr:glutamine--tRNA ligase/YqeY domain fusion protein [Veillonella agrestimuris]